MLKRRRFDLFALSYLGSCIYFLPGFFGVVLRAVGDTSLAVEEPLENGAYVVLLAVLGATLLSGVLYDVAHGSRGEEDGEAETAEKLSGVALVFATGFWITLLPQASDLLNVDKAALLTLLDRRYVGFQVFLTTAAILGIRERRWWVVGGTVPLFLFDMALAFRVTVALVVVSAVLVVLERGGPSRLAWRRKGLLFGSLAAAAFFFMWSQLFFGVRRGRWELSREQIARPDTYVNAVRRSEPFVTQGILNEVVRTRFKVPGEHLGEAIGVSLVPFYTSFFEAPKSFNDYFQPALFPGVEYGMANNIWAEAFAEGGFGGVVVAVILFQGLLWLGSRVLQAGRVHLHNLALLCGGYLAFYIHRNDLLYELVLLRRLIGAYMVIVVLAKLLLGAVATVRRAEGVAGTIPGRAAEPSGR